VGTNNWRPSDPAAWKVVKTDKGSYYSQFQMSKYKPPFRSPHNISLINGATMADFVLEAKVLSTGKDGDHRGHVPVLRLPGRVAFLLRTPGQEDRRPSPTRSSIVGGADCRKISTKTSKGTPWDDKWHQVKLVRAAQKGTIEVYFDDMKTPVMTAEDKTFVWGQVGIGSFDDSGHWSDIKLHGIKYIK